MMLNGPLVTVWLQTENAGKNTSYTVHFQDSPLSTTTSKGYSLYPDTKLSATHIISSSEEDSAAQMHSIHRGNSELPDGCFPFQCL